VSKKFLLTRGSSSLSGVMVWSVAGGQARVGSLHSLEFGSVSELDLSFYKTERSSSGSLSVSLFVSLIEGLLHIIYILLLAM
jgi:hypothetical protein